MYTHTHMQARMCIDKQCRGGAHLRTLFTSVAINCRESRPSRAIHRRLRRRNAPHTISIDAVSLLFLFRRERRFKKDVEENNYRPASNYLHRARVGRKMAHDNLFFFTSFFRPIFSSPFFYFYKFRLDSIGERESIRENFPTCEIRDLECDVGELRKVEGL